MRRLIATLALLWGLTGAVDAAAAPDKLLDLRQPTVVADALHEAGYTAEIKTNAKGEPYVLSSANGSNFTIEFYNCTGLVDCTSYQFSSWYKPDPMFTPAFANEWNYNKRFLKVAIDKDGNLNEYMDFTATGKPPLRISPISSTGTRRWMPRSPNSSTSTGRSRKINRA